MLGREDFDVIRGPQHFAGQRVDLGDAVDLVAEELDAVGQVGVGRLHFQCVAAHAEPAAPQLHIVALVKDVDQLAQHLLAPVLRRHAAA